MTTKLSFKDFIKSKPTNAALPSPESELNLSLTSNLSNLDKLGLFEGNSKKAQNFEKKIVTELESDQTIDEISTLIGTPNANETEDEFVKRASDKLEDYLMRKFSK